MRRAALLLTALATLALPAAAAAAPGDPPRLRAALTACETGPEELDRIAAFTGSMPARRDTVRMAIRFDLQQRTVDGGVWRRLEAPTFGRWERSRPGVAGFVYTKDVKALPAPGEYRAVVRFRWHAADGGVRTVRRVTRTCRQPDPRPDLVARRVEVLPTALPALATYRVRVRNAGRGHADAFAVALLVGGVEAGRATVAGLAPRTSVTVQIVAPRCLAGTAVEARVDAAGAVDEADEGNGTAALSCPPVG